MSCTIFAPCNPLLPPVNTDSFSYTSSCAYSLGSLSNFQISNTYEIQDSNNKKYSRKRELKNDSVRRSREKSKKIAEENEVQVELLTTDNQVLSQGIHSMELELAKLKQAFQQQCVQESLALQLISNRKNSMNSKVQTF